MTPPRALTEAEIITAFGNPAPYLREDGDIKWQWEVEILSLFDLPAPLRLLGNPGVMVTRARCHKRVAPHLYDALYAIHKVPGLWATINDWGGCYAWRLQRRANVRSRHCWGLGPDMDVSDNLQGDTTPGVNAKVVQLMEDHGFYWGGRFGGSRTDAMHFEFCDLARLT